jgi:hypothetical protein
VKSILRRRPSPALAISCVALFLSLGGVSYGLATGSIDSRELKDNTVRSNDIRNDAIFSKDIRNDALFSKDVRNNTVRSADIRNNTLRTFDVRNNEIRGFDIRNSSVQGRDVALNTLTGADVSEESLGKVPSAAAADTAASAGNANTVGGMSVAKFFAKQDNGTAPTEVFRGQGFVIEAGCQAGNAVLQLDGIAGAPTTNVTVSATGNAAMAAANVIFTSDNTLTPGDDLDLLPGTNTEAAGTATVSTTAGAVATIVYGAESSPAFSGESVCASRGTVVSG